MILKWYQEVVFTDLRFISNRGPTSVSSTSLWSTFLKMWCLKNKTFYVRYGSLDLLIEFSTTSVHQANYLLPTFQNPKILLQKLGISSQEPHGYLAILPCKPLNNPHKTLEYLLTFLRTSQALIMIFSILCSVVAHQQNQYYADLNDMKSSSFANVITRLLSSLGTGNRYFKMLWTWIKKI